MGHPAEERPALPLATVADSVLHPLNVESVCFGMKTAPQPCRWYNHAAPSDGVPWGGLVRTSMLAPGWAWQWIDVFRRAGSRTTVAEGAAQVSEADRSVGSRSDKTDRTHYRGHRRFDLRG